jgi:hypothetical protein
MKRRKHHVVSAGYQRFFGDDTGRLRLVEKATRTAIARLVGVRDAFVQEHFNSITDDDGHRSDELESEWERLERFALPRVRELDPHQVSEADDAAIKVLMAIHFARSYAARAMHDRLAAQTLSDYDERMRHNAQLKSLYRREQGRDPEPGEVEGLAAEIWGRHQATNKLFVDTMSRAHNFAVERFRPLGIDLVVPAHPNVQFGTGDTPVVVTNRTMTILGPLQGLALGDSDFVYMPLRRDLGAVLTTRTPLVVSVSGVQAQLLNGLVWRNAIRQVACHPEDDWRRLFAA